jgi:hypothetical protein
MKIIAYRIPRILLALTVCVCVLQALAATAPLSAPARADLPPRPTPTPVVGGAIQLQVQFPQTLAHPWQELWTVVQWQDRQGHWHDVQGWQGTLDEAVVEDGQPLGHKTWWVGAGDLGKGPFRWLVQRNTGGRVLATSAPFDLPGYNKATVTVEVTLAP